MTARSSSFLCPKRPNAPTSAAAFAQLPSPSCYRPSGYRPSGLRPAAHWHLPHRLSSQRFSASAAASPQCYLRHRCGSHPEHKNADYVLETPENEGLEGQKRTKTPILCSGREGIGIGKHGRRDAYRKRGLPANHRARFKNSNTS